MATVAQNTVEPQVDDYIRRAKIAREQRAAAPMTGDTGRIRIRQKEAFERFSKDSGGQDGEFHFMFGDRELSDFYADHGYEPVLFQGRHHQIDGDPMWKIPTEMFDEDIAQVEAQSNRILQSKRTLSQSTDEVHGTTEVKVTDGEGNVKVDTFTEPE